MNKTQTIRIPLAELQEHKKNTIIYGHEDIRDLAEQIKNSGWIKVLTISQRTGENVIIAGNSCFKAARLLHGKEHEGKTLDFSELECRVEDFANEWEEIERLVLDNSGRQKTVVQKAQEAKYLEQAQRMAAQERKKKGTQGEKLPEAEKGRVRDILAEKVGLGSGRTLEKALKVNEAIEKLKEDGREEDAKILKDVLNRSVDGALNLIQSGFLDKAPEDLKKEVRTGKLSTRKAIDYVKAPEFVLTDEIISKTFKKPPIVVAKTMSENEARQWCRLFGLPFFSYMWGQLEDKGAFIRCIVRSPKALVLYRAYFYTENERDLLSNNILEAKDIYDLCKWFGIGNFPNSEVQTKEEAAKKLVPFLNDMKYEKVS